MTNTGNIKSFVLRSGRMSRAQEKSYKAGGKYIIPFSNESIDFSRYFTNNNPLTVEIGFGMGKATADIAEANAGNNYLGIEVFRAGVGKLLWEIEQRSLTNVRIVEYDAVAVIEKMIKPFSVSAFHIFFPDPWPKKRHHKRRLVQNPFAKLLVSRLIPGGYIYMVSDWENYADEALAVFSVIPELSNPNGLSFADGISWRPMTKFEKKGLDKNHSIKEIYLVKQ
ncbi:MAG: tRNA (guanosine(46)-N7)-methyltransferase TrmB [Treponema sp.]|nr:tRNA (guanosine(46)-N7)-methyltransferase TrmB [Treponema sp.]